MPKLHIIEDPTSETIDWKAISRRVRGVLTGRAWWYAGARFRVIPPRYLDDIIQYLPREGVVVDMGCGYGLFTACFALARPNCRFIGVDIDAARIAHARKVAEKLGITNLEFFDKDVCELHDSLGVSPDALMMFDLIHHIPPAEGEAVLQRAWDCLKPGGTFLVKDVGTTPRWKLHFTYLADMLTSDAIVYYRSKEAWLSCLHRIGAEQIYSHHQWDSLPYPHLLFISRKPHEVGTGTSVPTYFEMEN